MIDLSLIIASNLAWLVLLMRCRRQWIAVGWLERNEQEIKRQQPRDPKTGQFMAR